jgi:hypothetical protein
MPTMDVEFFALGKRCVCSRAGQRNSIHRWVCCRTLSAIDVLSDGIILLLSVDYFVLRVYVGFWIVLSESMSVRRDSTPLIG